MSQKLPISNGTILNAMVKELTYKYRESLIRKYINAVKEKKYLNIQVYVNHQLVIPTGIISEDSALAMEKLEDLPEDLQDIVKQQYNYNKRVNELFDNVRIAYQTSKQPSDTLVKFFDFSKNNPDRETMDEKFINQNEEVLTEIEYFQGLNMLIGN